MKTGIFRKTILPSVFLFAIVMFVACETITETDIKQKLVIEKGTIERVGSNSLGEIIYNLSFTYYVNSEACEVGGYSISFETERVIISSWYQKQFLEPGKKYTRSDRFTINSELTAGPTLRMTGYLVNSSDSHKGLKDQKTIQLK